MFSTKKDMMELTAQIDQLKADLEAAQAEKQSLTEKVAQLETELAGKTESETDLNAQLTAEKQRSADLQATNRTLTAENAELRKLPGAEPAMAASDKEIGRADEHAIKLATSDDKSFVENMQAVTDTYLKR